MRLHRMPLPFLVLALSLAAPARAEPLELALADLQGTEVRLSDYRGRWVVLNLWASWCAPCREAARELTRFQNQHPDARVLGISVEDTPAAELAPVVAELGLNYPVLPAGDRPPAPFRPLKGLPTTAVIDPDGELAAVHTGVVAAEVLGGFIRACEGKWGVDSRQ